MKGILGQKELGIEMLSQKELGKRSCLRKKLGKEILPQKELGKAFLPTPVFCIILPPDTLRSIKNNAEG